jgi:hypothetical protein
MLYRSIMKLKTIKCRPILSCGRGFHPLIESAVTLLKVLVPIGLERVIYTGVGRHVGFSSFMRQYQKSDSAIHGKKPIIG